MNLDIADNLLDWDSYSPILGRGSVEEHFDDASFCEEAGDGDFDRRNARDVDSVPLHDNVQRLIELGFVSLDSLGQVLAFFKIVLDGLWIRGLIRIGHTYDHVRREREPRGICHLVPVVQDGALPFLVLGGSGLVCVFQLAQRHLIPACGEAYTETVARVVKGLGQSLISAGKTRAEEAD